MLSVTKNGAFGSTGSPYDLDNKEERILVLDFIAAELISLRAQKRKQQSKEARVGSTDDVDTSALTLGEQGASLPKILEHTTFNIERQLACGSLPPPTNCFSQKLHYICERVRSLLEQLGVNQLPEQTVLLNESQLNENQKATIRRINEYMKTEYRVRRQMLLGRLDVTMQSFLWKDNIRDEDNFDIVLQSVYSKRQGLSEEPVDISLEELFHVGSELPRWLSTKITSTPQSTSIKNVVIGDVPDRGGRVDEQRPSMKDIMPQWAAPSHQKGAFNHNQRGGRGGGGGNKRVQHFNKRGRGGGGGWKAKM